MSNKCSNYFFSYLFVRNMHLDVAHAHTTAIHCERPTARDPWCRDDSIREGTHGYPVPVLGPRVAAGVTRFPVPGPVALLKTAGF